MVKTGQFPLGGGALKTYRGIPLVPEEFAVMEALEKILGKSIPPRGEMFAFKANPEGHVIMLTISNQKLASLPSNFGNLSYLRSLALGGNKLSSLPASFCRLGSLEYLILSNNCLTELPADFGNLRSLKVLYIFNNQLTGLPASFARLTALDDANFQHNPLAPLPEALGNMKALKHLKYEQNAQMARPETPTPQVKGSQEQGNTQVILTAEQIFQLLNGPKFAPIKSRVLPLCMNSIRIQATSVDEDLLKPGASKLGGNPDLPAGIEWPAWSGVPLAFIAQFNLRELVAHDLEKVLPLVGFLYFFYDAKQEVWGFDPKDRGRWQVLFLKDETAPLARRHFPDALPEEGQYPSARLTFKSDLTLPNEESLGMLKLGWSREEMRLYGELLETLHADEDHTEKKSRVLGSPDPIQGEMSLECQLASNGLNRGDASGYEDPQRAALEAGAQDWQLLLQVDSEDDAGMMWGDVGRLYYWIRRQDLKKADFGNAWVILQCG